MSLKKCSCCKQDKDHLGCFSWKDKICRDCRSLKNKEYRKQLGQDPKRKWKCFYFESSQSMKKGLVDYSSKI